MRDINRAERLLSLFTSPDSAAGIVGDLSEEMGLRGNLWFWRQVLGTALSLCRGTLFESPMVVLLLVALGFALSVGVSLVTSGTVVNLLDMHPPMSGWLIFLISALFTWPAKVIAGATMVAAAPRIGMVACVLMAGVQGMLVLLRLASSTSEHSRNAERPGPRTGGPISGKWLGLQGIPGGLLELAESEGFEPSKGF